MKLSVSNLSEKTLESLCCNRTKSASGAQHGAFKQEPGWIADFSVRACGILLSEVEIIAVCFNTVPLWAKNRIGSLCGRHCDEVESLVFVVIAKKMSNETNETSFPMEVDADATSREFKHVKRFDGKANGQSVDEFLARVESLARIRKWDDEEKAAQLLDLTTDKAFLLLSNVPKTAEGQYDRLVAELRNAYGISMERAIGLLSSRKLLKGETVYDYASDLRNYTLICLPSLSEEDRSKVAAIHFWRGLHQSEAVRHLFGTWKCTQRSLEKAIELTADLAESPDSHSFVANYHKGRGSKPRFENKRWPNPDIAKQGRRKCYTCGGYGHEARNCATKSSVCKNLIISMFNNQHCLLDTGCSYTMCSLGAVVEKHVLFPLKTRIQGFNGFCTSENVVKTLSVLGVELSNVAVYESPIVIDGREIHYILGMDYIRAVGGLSIEFDNEGRAVWVPNGPVVMNMLTVPKQLVETETQTEDVDQEEEQEAVSDSGIPLHRVTAKIVLNDMILRRYCSVQEPEKQFWEVEWLWIDNSPPAPSWNVPNYGVDKLDQEDKKGFIREVQLWEDQGFIVPVDPKEVKCSIPLMCVEQPGKTTLYRPVADFKKTLNQFIISQPNEDIDLPVSANMMLLKWRALNLPLSELVLVDISKAYMRIRVKEELTYYQCFVLPWKEPRYYRLARLGFGVNIAVKCLRVILNYILDEEKIDKEIIVPYVDDMPCPKDKVARLKEALLRNGFDIKLPEEMSQARALGLCLKPDGRWRRKGGFPELPTVITRRTIHQWCGKITAHYPTSGWLRPACSQLKRLTTMSWNGKTPTWDEPVQSLILQIVNQFDTEIMQRGDAIGGQWSFNKNHEWELFTDASKYALGCVLRIGGVVVLDGTWLRKVNDTRQINIPELEAVLKGVGVVYQAKRALGLKEVTVKIFCDNVSAVAWLNRKEARHWTTTKGSSEPVVEEKLNQYYEMLRAGKIAATVTYVESKSNLSDALSRIPKYMVTPKEAAEEGVCMLVRIPRTSGPIPVRNEEALIEMSKDDPHFEVLLRGLHEHEGAHSLFERMRRVVKVPHLRELCRDFVARCVHCQMSKVTVNAEYRARDSLGEREGESFMQADVPWRVVHMDVQGPFCSDALFNRNFIITLVDRFSGYLLIQCSRSSPNADQLVALFRRVKNVFNAIPETVYSDNGTIFTSVEFVTRVVAHHCQVMRSPVGAHWCNGKVERKHRILHEQLLAHAVDADFATFQDLAVRTAQNLNTAPSGRTGTSSHEIIFGYPAWTHEKVPLYLRPNRPSPMVDQSSQRERADEDSLPKEGQLWLLRAAAVGVRMNKLTRPFIAVRIRARISPKVYLIRLVGGKEKTVHLRHLKKVSPEMERNMPAHEVP